MQQVHICNSDQQYLIDNYTHMKNLKLMLATYYIAKINE